MEFSGLVTSVGINIGICVLFLMFYSVLRNQRAIVKIYFGRRIAEQYSRLRGGCNFERFVPSTGWVVKALQCTEEELLDAARLDAVVFDRIIVFSIRIFSVATLLGLLGILPVNYYFGQNTQHVSIPSERMDAFTVSNVKHGSKCLLIHCAVLYIISGVTCLLLYIEGKHIATLRSLYLKRSTLNPSQFALLVREIPKTAKESYSDAVGNFFTKYHSSSYLFHQIVYKVGHVHKIMTGTKTAHKKFKHFIAEIGSQGFRTTTTNSCFMGPPSPNSSKFNSEGEQNKGNPDNEESTINLDHEECATAFVFFKTRYDAVTASNMVQTSNPLKWVTSLAPEPEDVYWSNLWQSNRCRKSTLVPGCIIFAFLLLMPMVCIQSLSDPEQLQQLMPASLKERLEKKNYMTNLITGYLPSVIQQIILYIVGTLMMKVSKLEGATSHSARKRSACFKLLCFIVWNIFFVNVLSGTFMSQLNLLLSPKDIPVKLARALTRQATFFITYVMTSGWASLSSELLQFYNLIMSFIRKYILRKGEYREDTESVPTFPYQQEVPKVLLFGLLGFTCSVVAPMILPFLLVYFYLGRVVYRNQFLNVYRTRSDTGGLYWPIAHNTIIFSLVLTQIICAGVFEIKESRVAVCLTIPLIICTLSFHLYYKRSLLLFKTIPTQ
ncbi:hypothetical protein ACJX0J_041526, partial [Zea mays]